jgi:hypothetical protein
VGAHFWFMVPAPLAGLAGAALPDPALPDPVLPDPVLTDPVLTLPGREEGEACVELW